MLDLIRRLALTGKCPGVSENYGMSDWNDIHVIHREIVEP